MINSDVCCCHSKGTSAVEREAKENMEKTTVDVKKSSAKSGVRGQQLTVIQKTE